jgi:hypothetical protein
MLQLSAGIADSVAIENIVGLPALIIAAFYVPMRIISKLFTRFHLREAWRHLCTRLSLPEP